MSKQMGRDPAEWTVSLAQVAAPEGIPGGISEGSPQSGCTLHAQLHACTLLSGLPLRLIPGLLLLELALASLCFSRGSASNRGL